MSKNRMANCHNKYQGSIKKVLCVCSAGLLRSPTAANVLHRELGYNTRAAGLSEDFALIYADDVLLEWCDEIVVMSEKAKEELELRTSKPIVNLDILDQYGYMDEELQIEILEKYVGRP